jgi:hypothetical protein
MTDTTDMLGAVPTDIPLDATDVAAAIDSCLQCVQACITCADADLVEPDFAEMRDCIVLCLNSAELCNVTARVLSRPAHWDQFVVDRLLQACVRACTKSAEECARHAQHHRHCAVCAKVCRECVYACSELLDDDTLAQLENIAGG